jgi:hypothetical protein
MLSPRDGAAGYEQSVHLVYVPNLLGRPLGEGEFCQTITRTFPSATLNNARVHFLIPPAAVAPQHDTQGTGHWRARC